MEELTAMFRVCVHIKNDGERCNSPALGGLRFCYQHIGGTTSSLLRARSTTFSKAGLDFAYPADRESIQHNLFLVAQALDEGRIDVSIANTYNRIFKTCEQNLHRWEKANKGAKKGMSPLPDETPESSAPSMSVIPTEASVASAVEGPALSPSRENAGAPAAEDSKQEVERRVAIIEKHKHRFLEIERLYLNHPDYGDRVKTAIHEILDQELPTTPSMPLSA